MKMDTQFDQICWDDEAYNQLKIVSRLNLSLTSELMQFKASWCRFAYSTKEDLVRDFHQHIVAELHYICKGEQIFQFQSDGSTVHVKPGQYVLIPPSCVHALSLGDPDTVKFVIGFTAESDNSCISAAFNALKAPTASSNPLVTAVIDTLRQQAMQDHLAKRFSVRYLINAMILEVLESEALKNGVYQENESLRMTRSDWRMDAMKAFIDEHIFENIHSEDVADHINLQLRQANRICKKYSAHTINELITFTRIDRIKVLLDSTDYTLTKIAEIAGFSSVYSFIRHFRTNTGVSPGVYRKEAARR